MQLSQLTSPEDIRSLTYDEMNGLAAEIRETLIETVARRGGHLASNLGVVELTLALHRVFDTPADKLVFDVGHQSYVHKLLTGRYARFGSLRSFGGLSGFPKRGESECDTFETGHASTAISAALGMARARDMLGQKHRVVAVVGDGAMTGGMCYEALNDAGSADTQLLVILNDNEMSIAPNVGALSKYLTNLRVSQGYTSTKKRVRQRLKKLPVIGKPMYKAVHWVKNKAKSLLTHQNFFETLGFQYYGPIDGHDLPSLERTLRKAREYDGPAVLHVLTCKGHGYDKAEQSPEMFHGVPPFYVETGDVRDRAVGVSFGEAMAQELTAMTADDPRVMAITAAMPAGTGLSSYQKEYPDHVLDVGIAEEHAVTMAAGLAAGGMKPYFAVYASFFQRSHDQMIHDVCMQHLPVTFLLDRAGLVGQDGATHHGVYDLAQLLPVPGMTVLAPRDVAELRAMIRWTNGCGVPVAVRYGRDTVDMSADYPYHGFTPGKWEVLEEGCDCTLLAVGSMVTSAVAVRRLLAQEGVSAAVVNCSTVKPMDEDFLHSLKDKAFFTMEEHVLIGGFGSAVSAFCVREEMNGPLATFGIDDMYVQHGRRDQLMKYLGLLPAQMARRIALLLKERNAR